MTLSFGSGTTHHFYFSPGIAIVSKKKLAKQGVTNSKLKIRTALGQMNEAQTIFDSQTRHCWKLSCVIRHFTECKLNASVEPTIIFCYLRLRKRASTYDFAPYEKFLFEQLFCSLNFFSPFRHYAQTAESNLFAPYFEKCCFVINAWKIFLLFISHHRELAEILKTKYS